MKLKFIYLLIVSTSILVGSAAYFSVIGFSALFAGSFISVVILISGLELAKLVVTSFLYKYWGDVSTILKSYMLVAIAALMIITSAGIYGFLSSAYMVTSNKMSLIDGSISIYEKRKEVIQEYVERMKNNIKDKNRRGESLMLLRTSQESRLDTLYKRNMIKSAKRTEQIIKDADNEITFIGSKNDSLSKMIQVALDSSGKIDMKILELNSSNVKGDIGPLKYIATLTGKSIDNVVNFFILLLVFISDPLAVAMVIAVNKVLLEQNRDVNILQYNWLYKWRQDRGDETLRLDYNLSKDSIIFDIGNIELIWVERMYEKYKCTIYIFEPVKSLYIKLCEKFKDDKKIKIYNLEPDIEGEDNIVVLLNSLNIEKVDLIKINMQGAEYKLLSYLLNNDECEYVKNYQIQFSSLENNYLTKYDEVKKKFLERGYVQTYCYPFVWENFKKN